MIIRTLEQLSETLDSDLAWRKKELANLGTLLPGRRAHGTMLLRAGVCLLYAHWEGFVRTASIGYVSYVAHSGLRYRDLSPNFLAMALRQDITEAGRSNLPTLHIGLTIKLMSELSDRARINWENSINTRSNLNSEALKEILAQLGIEAAPYLPKGALLDQRLLASRNQIAHGGQSEIDLGDYRELQGEVILLADTFNNDIQNAAATRMFRK